MGGRGSTRAAILVPTSRDGDGAGRARARARARGGVVGDLVFFLNHERHETHEKKIVWLRFVWEGEVPPEPQSWFSRTATVTERDEHEVVLLATWCFFEPRKTRNTRKENRVVAICLGGRGSTRAGARFAAWLEPRRPARFVSGRSHFAVASAIVQPDFWRPSPG